MRSRRSHPPVLTLRDASFSWEAPPPPPLGELPSARPGGGRGDGSGGCGERPRRRRRGRGSISGESISGGPGSEASGCEARYTGLDALAAQAGGGATEREQSPSSSCADLRSRSCADYSARDTEGGLEHARRSSSLHAISLELRRGEVPPTQPHSPHAVIDTPSSLLIARMPTLTLYRIYILGLTCNGQSGRLRLRLCSQG